MGVGIVEIASACLSICIPFRVSFDSDRSVSNSDLKRDLEDRLLVARRPRYILVKCGSNFLTDERSWYLKCLCLRDMLAQKLVKRYTSRYKEAEQSVSINENR